MTRNFAFSLTAAAMVMGLAYAASGSAEASMTSRLQNCIYPNKNRVISCCQQVIKRKKPFWMMESGASCASAAVCSTKKVIDTSAITHVAYKKVKVCSIQVMTPPPGGGGSPGDDTPQRNPQSRPTFNRQ
jgi:hypothetical protein